MGFKEVLGYPIIFLIQRDRYFFPLHTLAEWQNSTSRILGIRKSVTIFENFVYLLILRNFEVDQRFKEIPPV